MNGPFSLAAGQTVSARVVDELTRAHIAQYAGASGDYNLVHVDESFAVGAGYPSTIAHGMLTMGLTATFLTSWVGHGRIRKYGGRFLAPVLPGDSLDCSATVVAVESGPNGPAAEITVQASRAAGDVVFRGWATIDLGA